MKCPKCEFVSFDGLDTCKRCGYNFVTKKGGKKLPFFSGIFEKVFKKDGEASLIKGELQEEPEEVPGGVLEDEISEEGMPEAAVSGEVKEDEEFDDQFEGLFGDDKEAVKGGDEDVIKITATDSKGDTEDDVPDYGFKEDPFSDDILARVGENQLFNEIENNVEEYTVPKDVTYGDLGGKAKESEELPESLSSDDSDVKEDYKEIMPEAEKTSENDFGAVTPVDETPDIIPIKEEPEEEGAKKQDAEVSQEEDAAAEDFMKSFLTEDSGEE